MYRFFEVYFFARFDVYFSRGLDVYLLASLHPNVLKCANLYQKVPFSSTLTPKIYFETGFIYFHMIVSCRLTCIVFIQEVVVTEPESKYILFRRSVSSSVSGSVSQVGSLSVSQLFIQSAKQLSIESLEFSMCLQIDPNISEIVTTNYCLRL